MKILRKKVVNCILLCIFLAGFMMMIPQNAQAAKSKFVVKNGVLIKYNGHGKKITIPKNVRTIKEQAFFGCSDLQTVTIPGNVKKIGQCAFAYCPDLKKVVMKNGVTTIMAEAFSGCGKLDSVTIPKSTKTINELAFDETPWLMKKRKQQKDKLVIVNHILIDGRYAKGKIKIPKGVTAIAESAFAWNKKISGITIPSTVKTVGVGAFAVTNIKKITFPKSVKSIGQSVLCLNDELKEVTILNPKAKVMWNNDYTGGTIFDGLVHIEGFVGDKIVIRGYKNSTAAKLAKHINGLSNKSAKKRYKKAVFKTLK